MPIEEKIIKATKPGEKDQWEITATGKEVAELSGHLKDAADYTNERNEKENARYGMIEMENAKGKRDVYREDKARYMERKGFKPAKKSFVVPDLPWLNKDKRGN